MEPLSLAEREHVHNLVKQDRKLMSTEPINIPSPNKSKQNRTEDYKSDFQTISKVRNFVSKYYKDSDSNQGI